MCLAIPGRVMELYTTGDMPMARVDFDGVRRAVCLSCTPEAAVGSWVVVHVGFAISVVDEAEAQRTLALLEELGELAETEGEEEASEAPGDEGADLADPPRRT